MIKNVSHKNPNEVYAEWDALAPIRLKQILSGKDVTYNHVLSPLIHELVSKSPKGPILDLGCGVGVMTDELAKYNSDVTGVDPSKISISLAKSMFFGNVKFETRSAEEYAQHTKKRFSVIVSNMVLMDAIFLDSFVDSVSKLLKRGGVFIFSITHPCFWPDYYGYLDKDWFEYGKEIIVESPFKISNQQDCRLNSTHVHRPLHRYISAFVGAGLEIDGLFEPLPSDAAKNLYSKPWRFPRYLVGQCRLPKKI